MTEGRYDVVIVGARCAGAALATFLARAGARVLLLDKDQRATEHVLSTHWIHPPGLDVLDELGVGEALRSVTPPSRRMRIDLEGQPADFVLDERRPAFCPRRRRLDALLQHRAESEGARFIDRARVVGLVRESGRVRGVHAIVGDRERTFAAGLVVGADGRRSSVAEWVGAEEYLGYDAPRATWWGYWSAPHAWRRDPAFGFDAYFGLLGDQVHAIFQTDHDRLLIACSPRIEHASVWRADPSTALVSSLARNPTIAPLIAGRSPEGMVRGAVRERFFFRAAAGRGWVLVGDAGHHKEFLLGDGITEALIQARSLAAAIGARHESALSRWWRRRDVEALPHYWLGRLGASAEPRSDLLRSVFTRAARDPRMMAMIVRSIEERLSPFEAMPARELLAFAAAAAWRGQWRALGETLDLGREVLALSRELDRRRELLDAVESQISEMDSLDRRAAA